MAPIIIQGGMGIAVSGWRLAQAVSKQGQLGVISGTAIDAILVRRLQDGDPDGALRRAIARFPYAEVGQRVIDRYFIQGGKRPEASYLGVPMWTDRPPKNLVELNVLASFVEVSLAKEGHSGIVGMNLLTKIALPNPALLYGAMLAGVDYILMGAGIPKEIPAALDALSQHRRGDVSLSVDGAAQGSHKASFDPSQYFKTGAPLRRPKFIAVVGSATLAKALAKHADHGIHGFVVEHLTAGGHNAPPRGPLRCTEDGEPIYGPRDEIDLQTLKDIGMPFWLGGSYSTPERVCEALALGAQGVQIGTLFALCDESGFDPALRYRILARVRGGAPRVRTDRLASPTGFPFKVFELEGTASEPAVYESRPRRCNLGYLRSAYLREDGSLGFRCPGEPTEEFLAKGGTVEEQAGRKCLCNGLVANVGHPQAYTDGYLEPALVTTGFDFTGALALLQSGRLSYSAADALRYLLSKTPAQASSSAS